MNKETIIFGFCLFSLRFLLYLCSAFANTDAIGEMVEWSITPVLKTGVLRGTGGSNPSLSAESKFSDF